MVTYSINNRVACKEEFESALTQNGLKLNGFTRKTISYDVFLQYVLKSSGGDQTHILHC